MRSGTNRGMSGRWAKLGLASAWLVAGSAAIANEPIVGPSPVAPPAEPAAIPEGVPPAGADLLEPYRAHPGPHEFTSHAQSVTDRGRADPRVIRWIAYVPELLPGDPPAPLVVVSQHFGHTAEGMTYLANHLASWGYVVAVVEHPSTNEESMALRDRNALPRALNVDNRIANVQDLSVVITEMSRAGRIETPVDLGRIAVVGHGFGSYTALQLAGKRAETSRGPFHRLRDPRVRAVVSMSPDGTVFHGIDAASFDHIEVPVLYMTGTQDRGRWTHNPSLRREPYQYSAGSDQFLWIMREAQTHYFTDDELGDLRMPRPAGAHEDILAAVTAFLDAYLRADPIAHEWLVLDGPVSSSPIGITFEHKRVRPFEEIERALENDR